jgi:hypothetical protein
MEIFYLRWGLAGSQRIGRIIKKDSVSSAGYTVLSSRPILLEKLDRKNFIRAMGLEEYQDTIRSEDRGSATKI